MKLKKILMSLLSLSMVCTLFGSISVKAEESEYTAGVVVTEASEEDLAGDYGTAYSITGYKATFTYIEAEDDENDGKTVTAVKALGSFCWVSQEFADGLAENDYEDDIEYSTAYEIDEEDMIQYVSFSELYEYTEVEDGVWQLEMPVFAGQYFYYLFIYYEDGTSRTQIADPGNNDTIYVEDDDISLFYVGDSSTVNEDEQYIFPIEDESQAGTIVSASVTAINGETQSVSIYLPAGYDEDTEYKVLYLCHGLGDSDTRFLTITSLANIMDNLIAEGEVEETIVVMMNNSVFDSINTFEGAENVLENIVDVLIPYMEENYNVSTEAEGRAIAGYSAGGNNTLYAIDEYTDYFKYYGVFSAGDEYDYDEDSDFSDIVVYLVAGNLEGSYNVLGTETNYENIVSYGASASYEYVGGTHAPNTWRKAISNFVKDILWSEEEADAEYEGGVVVTEASEEDLAGEYGTAYSITGYKATFTFIEDEDNPITSVAVFGDFLWCDRDDVEALADDGYVNDIETYYTAYEIFEDDMVQYITMYFYYYEEVDDGVWQLEMPVFAGEYMYWLIINYEDGSQDFRVVDPGNPSTKYVENDTISFFYVGSADDVDESQAYIFEIEDESQAGTIVSTSVTATNGEEQAISIYLPAGYDEDTEYKVLYLLHGDEEKDTTWLTGVSAANILDNLIADGEVEATIVVMINDSVFDDLDTTEGATNVVENLIEVVIPYIEANYNVSTDAEGRAVAGYSAGGNAVIYALDTYTEYFSYYGAFSSGYEYTFSEDNDYSDVVVYLAAGNLETGDDGGTIVGAYTHYEDLLALGATAYYDIVDGNHYYRAWREAFSTFVKDILWSETDDDEETTTTTTTTQIVASSDDDTTEESETVETGDTTNANLYLGLGFIALMTLAGVSYKKRMN